MRPRWVTGVGHGAHDAQGPEGTPGIGRKGAFLALSDSDLALVKIKSGLMKPEASEEVLTRVPRAAVASVEFGEGKPACPLTIAFANGVTWHYDVPRGGKKAAEEVAAALGGGAA